MSVFVNDVLTGRVRYRVQTRIFRTPLVVLQVEAKCDDGPPDYHGLPQYFAATYWRDARVEDLSNLPNPPKD